MIFGGLGSDYIDPGTGPGTQVSEGGTSVGSGFVATATPNPGTTNPLSVPDPAAVATLPGNLPTAGIWVSLAGDPGSELAQAGSTAMGSSIAVNGSTTYVAWVDQRSGVDAVYVAAQSGSAWSELAGSAEQGGVSGLVETAANPSLALLPDGTPIVAWTVETSSGTDIQLAEYSAAANAGAGGWVALGTSLSAGGLSGTGHASNAQLVLVGSTPVVAWLDTSSGVANVYAKEFNGTSWVAFGIGRGFGERHHCVHHGDPVLRHRHRRNECRPGLYADCRHGDADLRQAGIGRHLGRPGRLCHRQRPEQRRVRRVRAHACL